MYLGFLLDEYGQTELLQVKADPTTKRSAMSKKDVTKSKPTKGKDTAKKESGVQPDLNAIREAVIAANVAQDVPFPDLVKEAHSVLGRIAEQIDVPVKTEGGYAEFASLAEQFNFIDREVKVGREAIAELEMKKHVFETFLDDGLQLSERYGSEEVIKLVANLLGRLVDGKSPLDEFRAGGPTYDTFKVPTLPSDAHPLNDEPSGGWTDGTPG